MHACLGNWVAPVVEMSQISVSTVYTCEVNPTQASRCDFETY